MGIFACIGESVANWYRGPPFVPQMTLSDISPIASAIALVVSLFTLWLTVLRRGTVRSTHPTFVAFRYDFVDKKVPQAKIFFRSLLAS
jgi:hypothetical protein